MQVEELVKAVGTRWVRTATQCHGCMLSANTRPHIWHHIWIHFVNIFPAPTLDEFLSSWCSSSWNLESHCHQSYEASRLLYYYEGIEVELLFGGISKCISWLRCYMGRLSIQSDHLTCMPYLIFCFLCLMWLPGPNHILHSVRSMPCCKQGLCQGQSSVNLNVTRLNERWHANT